MVRIIRLLTIASMLVAGVMQVSSVRADGPLTVRDVLSLHETSRCVICDKSIEDVCWPEVVAVRCSDKDCGHATLVHTTCIESRKNTHTCSAECQSKLSGESKKCIDHALKVKASPNALIDPAHPLYQHYTAAPAENCPICMLSLTTWPDTIVLHQNHVGAGHAFHRKCIERLQINVWNEVINGHRVGYRHYKCPACNAFVDAEKVVIDAEKEGLKDPFALTHIQKYKVTSKSASIKVAVSQESMLMNAMKYRLFRYPTLFAACACMLHGAYVYSNANWLSVSEAANGMVASTLTGAGVGLFAACLHHAHEWASK